MNHKQVLSRFYRHEFAQLVACLTQRVGIQHLSLVEDAAHMSIEQALLKWEGNELPENPSAWLYKTAYNYFLSEVRSNNRKNELLAQHSALITSQ